MHMRQLDAEVHEGLAADIVAVTGPAAAQATARGLVGGGGGHEPARLAPFDEVRRVVGFDELDAFEAKYACD